MNNINKAKLVDNLNSFTKDIPADYTLAAKEAVNNKKERLLRDKYISQLINV